VTLESASSGWVWALAGVKWAQVIVPKPQTVNVTRVHERVDVAWRHAADAGGAC